ncbi:MAG: hypothetical protein ACTSSI_01125 [Candidatus Helarchaeota archaeon]
MKEIAELKTFLNKKIKDLEMEKARIEEELNIYKKAIEQVDSLLIKESFKTAADLYVSQKQEKPKTEAKKPLVEEVQQEEVVHEIKSAEGTLLGTYKIRGDTIQITPEKDFILTDDDAPLRSFFIGKILNKFKLADEKPTTGKKIPEDRRFNYFVHKDENGSIKNITIYNYGSSERLQEIQRTLNWTFRKIAEKRR